MKNECKKMCVRHENELDKDGKILMREDELRERWRVLCQTDAKL